MIHPWIPFASAPRDGSRFIAANDKWFTVCFRNFRVEPPTKLLGYAEGCRDIRGQPIMGPRFLEVVPNPDAGKRTEWWSFDNPVAFRDEHTLAPDYDGEFEKWEPTHWTPLFSAPDS